MSAFTSSRVSSSSAFKDVVRLKLLYVCKCRQLRNSGLWHDVQNSSTNSHPNSQTYCTARVREGELCGLCGQQDLSANRGPSVPRQLQGNSSDVCVEKKNVNACSLNVLQCPEYLICLSYNESYSAMASEIIGLKYQIIGLKSITLQQFSNEIIKVEHYITS